MSEEIEIAVVHVVDDNDNSPLHLISAELLAYYQQCALENEQFKSAGAMLTEPRLTH